MELEKLNLSRWLIASENEETDVPHFSDVDDTEYYDWYYIENDIDEQLFNYIVSSIRIYALNKLFIKMIDYCVNKDLCKGDQYILTANMKYKFYLFCYRLSEKVKN